MIQELTLRVDCFWLFRNCADGGIDYVCFRCESDAVEMLEGYQQPPQMPFIKKRKWLDRIEGYRHGSPLF